MSKNTTSAFQPVSRISYIALAVGCALFCVPVWKGVGGSAAACWTLAVIGCLLNLVAIEANGGRMPVFEREGYAADWTKNYQPATGSTHVPLLCDRIHMLHSIFSVGDFAIYIGGLACLARVVRMIAH